ncbi:MAG TPA: hypothetical protein DDW27_05805 [Bacteroidales bacterium]|nr:hypothetical protein [Bacteroidales bacterium]
MYWSGLRNDADGRQGVTVLRREEDEREKGRRGEGERPGDVFFWQFAIFMNRHSGSRLICIQISHKGTVIPSLGHPGRKITQMTSVIANPGAPGRRNPVPLNKCR